MKKYILGLLSVIMLSLPMTSYADKVKIAELNWQSGSMLANIDAYIIKNGYGHDVEIIPGGTEVTINSMLSNSSPDIFSEAWVNLLGAEANSAIESGTLGLVTQDIIAGAGEGFYIPNYILEANPELTSFEAVLARPDLFPHPEDPSKGAMMICPGGWSCQNQHINLFTAFDMEAKGWKLLDPGSGAGMDSAWQGAVAKEQALFGYYWSPTALVGSLGIVKLAWDTPYAGDDNWQSCISQPADTCSDPLPTAMPVAETGTIVVPESLTIGVLGYLAKRKMPEGVTETMLVFGTENQASAEEMAIEFMKLYPEVWESWVSSKAAENIWATLN